MGFPSLPSRAAAFGRALLPAPRQRLSAAAMAAAMLVGLAPASGAQVPSPIPSDLQNQVLNLIQRVTALEEKLATMTNGTTSMKVRAPFQVVDAGGRPILQVVEASGKASASPGIVISGAPASGHASLSLLNKSGSPVVDIANLPEEQGIALYDDAGRLRAGLGLDGVIETWDESKNAVLYVGPAADKSEAAVRLGKDQDGYALQVGAGSEVARLGEDAEGFGVLTLADEQENTRATITGDGTLQLWDASNKGILTVADDVTNEDAAVTIGGGESATRIKVGSGGRTVVMGTNGTVAAFAVFNKSTPQAAMGVTSTGRASMTLANDGEHNVATLEVGQGGQGKLGLSSADGNIVVEAGLSVEGVGVVNAYPHGMPGSFIKGQHKKK